jgi:hypothetical protein
MSNTPTNSYGDAAENVRQQNEARAVFSDAACP